MHTITRYLYGPYLYGPLACLILLVATTTGGISSESAPRAITQAPFHGWEAIHLSDGTVRVVLIPDIGRMVYFGPDEVTPQDNRLWLNPQFFPRPDPLPAARNEQGKVRWRNFGGFKVWPYPWTGWPPDPALDGGPCSVEMTDDTITLTTARSPALDVQISTSYRLDDQHQLLITISMEGPNQRAMWPVVQVPGQGRVIVPLDPERPLAEQVKSPHVEAADVATVLMPETTAGHYASMHAASHRKFDLQTTEGWLAHAGPAGGLRLSWQHPQPSAGDGDGEPPVYDGSFYFNDASDEAMKYLELECYSPQKTGLHSWDIVLSLIPAASNEH